MTIPELRRLAKDIGLELDYHPPSGAFLIVDGRGYAVARAYCGKGMPMSRSQACAFLAAGLATLKKGEKP